MKLEIIADTEVLVTITLTDNIVITINKQYPHVNFQTQEIEPQKLEMMQKKNGFNFQPLSLKTVAKQFSVGTTGVNHQYSLKGHHELQLKM